MKGLTGRQRQILEYLVDYQRAYGYPPSYREIAAQCGSTSLRVAQIHLFALSRKGYIQQPERASARAITLTLKTKRLYPLPLLPSHAEYFRYMGKVSGEDTWHALRAS